MKERVEYQVLIDNEASPSCSWKVCGYFATSKGIEHAHRVAVKMMRKTEPLTVHGSAALYRLVILPKGEHCDAREWTS